MLYLCYLSFIYDRSFAQIRMSCVDTFTALVFNLTDNVKHSPLVSSLLTGKFNKLLEDAYFSVSTKNKFPFFLSHFFGEEC